MIRCRSIPIFCVVAYCAAACSAFSADVAIISSSDILPYQTCREGIQEQLADLSIVTVTLGEDIGKAQEVLGEVKRHHPKVLIAIGPQAAFMVAQEQAPSSTKLFCMVLNPQRVLAKAGLFPGISLNIPPALQITTIKQSFPARRRIGVFYTKMINQETIDALSREATVHGCTLVGMPIASAQDIPGMLTAREPAFDVLLIIPDEALGSTKIVEYVIKEALRRSIPVVGYNSWFAKNGAVLSFVIDYKAIGKQTAACARRLLSGAALDGMIMPPERVQIVIDLKTAEKIGVAVSPDMLNRADEVQR
ncbi:MAG: hypothetical protein N3B18_07000 [Desulfobacterota bacterium]|nr:hypothetical protein [Thermodesulfobacteriota bacterium]